MESGHSVPTMPLPVTAGQVQEAVLRIFPRVLAHRQRKGADLLGIQ